MTGPDALQLIIGCLQAGDLLQAEHLGKEAISLQPDNADILHLLGVVYYQQHNYGVAIEHISKAIENKPEFPEAYNNMGAVLKEIGHHEEALKCYEKAITFKPDYPEAYNNMGLSLKASGRHDEAVRYYRHAIHHKPDFYEAYNNLGIVLKDIGCLDEAARCFQEVIHINPHYADAYNNLGGVFQEKGQTDRAVTYYQKAIDADYEHSYAHFNLSMALLLTGNFSQGWKEYEWRWKAQDVWRRRCFTRAMWDGSDIHGLTILLHAEQGLGDTIQFVRYVQMVVQRGAKVIVECQKELKSLLKSVNGVHKIIERGEELPSFDQHCPFLSLPLAFGTTIETIPADIPYIAADPLLISKWHDKIKGDRPGPRIGLVWAGKPTYKRDFGRSCQLRMFSPFARLRDISFYSLQKGDAAEQAGNPPEGMNFIDYTEGLEDFSETAAFIENLDLVISVDTAVAHLAGALGKPVWVLLPYVPDWRWLLDREDSPWYPSMRLFRQSSSRDWNHVIERITEEIIRIKSGNKNTLNFSV